jgi:hypothetical protein
MMGFMRYDRSYQPQRPRSKRELRIRGLGSVIEGDLPDSTLMILKHKNFLRLNRGSY